MKYKYHILALILIAFVSVGSFLFYGNFDWEPEDNEVAFSGIILSTSTAPSGKIVDASVISSPEEPPPGYVKYTNKRYGFYFYHAPQDEVIEYDEGGGAMTIVIENKEIIRGMQVFIVPYGGVTISEERFLADVPSGVRDNVEATTLGTLSIPAVTFTSYDNVLGDTREIWFIYKGHLYEVTTFKGVGNWFTPVIQSWGFL